MTEERRIEKIFPIEKSRGPWTSPSVSVKKKDGTCSLCAINYKKLNDVTKRDYYP